MIERIAWFIFISVFCSLMVIYVLPTLIEYILAPLMLFIIVVIVINKARRAYHGKN